MRIEIYQKFRIADHPILDHLGKSGNELIIGQGMQHIGVDKDGRWLRKCAHQVFALRQIHPGLATHRAIHLGQQSGGDLYT